VNPVYDSFASSAVSYKSYQNSVMLQMNMTLSSAF